MRRGPVLAAACALAATAAAPAVLAHPGHGPVAVDVRSFAFQPANIVVGQTDTVIWYFSGAVDRNHSVTADPGQAEAFDSDPGTGSPPQKERDSYYGRVFNRVGTFSYYCKNHSGMQGTVEVRPVAGTVDNVPPTLSRVWLSRKRTRGVVAFSLSEPADVLARVQRRRRGRWRTARAFDFSGRRGRNRRKVSLRGLAPGAHRLLLRAYDPEGRKSAAVAVRFRIRR